MLYSQILRESIGTILDNIITEAASLQDIHTKYYSNIPDKDFNAIIQADPTWKSDKPDKMGKFGKWLLNLYKKNLLKTEDLYKVKDDLALFVKYYNRIQDKDINHYQDTHTLTAAVEPFRNSEENGEEIATSNSDEVRKAKAGAKKVYEDSQWLILIPTTKEAAVYYGKNTRWCTAATSANNMFATYNSKGPLYICIDKPKNTKYQFHFETAQYMDAQDKDIQHPILQTIGMSESVAKSAFKSDAVLLDEKKSRYEKLCDGCYLMNLKALVKINDQGEENIIYDSEGYGIDAKWLGGNLIFVWNQYGTAVVNKVSETVVDKDTVTDVMPYGDRGSRRVFACQIKGGLCVCEVTPQDRIKMITRFRTTAIPDTLDGDGYDMTTFPQYLVYQSGVVDVRTGQRAFNVYSLAECKMVLEDVIHIKDDEYDRWISDNGVWYIGLRTALDANSYTYNDDEDDTDNYDSYNVAKYYRVFEDGTIKEDGDDYSAGISESRKRRVNEYLDKETGTPLLRAARKNGLDSTDIVKNQWVIHFTKPENAINIVKTGFKNGLSKDDLNKTTMTMSGRGKHTPDNGYFYGYDVDDLVDSNISLLNDIGSGYAVLCRVNGMKYYNEVDDDNQVMFADNGVRDKILLYRWGGNIAKGGDDGQVLSDDELWGVGCVNGNPLYHSTLGNVIHWVIENYIQYKGQLVGKTEVPRYGEYHEKSEEEYFSHTDLLPDNASNKYERWHSQQERDDDYQNHNKLFSQEEYAKFCKSKGVDVEKVKSEAEARLDAMDIPSDNREQILDNVIEFTLANLGVDWKKFVEYQEAKHPFYVRTRPDGEYWKWH